MAKATNEILKAYNEELKRNHFKNFPMFSEKDYPRAEDFSEIPLEWLDDYLQSISDSNFATEKKPQSRKKANRHRGSKGHQKDLARHGMKKLSRERYYVDSEKTSRKAFREAYYGGEGRHLWQYDNGKCRYSRANRKEILKRERISDETVERKFSVYIDCIREIDDHWYHDTFHITDMYIDVPVDANLDRFRELVVSEISSNEIEAIEWNFDITTIGIPYCVI